MTLHCSIPLLFLVTGQAWGSRQSISATLRKVSPDLHPESDKKFFGKDYPDDLRPHVKDHFNYPFPIVEESDDYDKDFVKDENHDNGEWKAQTTYDHLRQKLSDLNSDSFHLSNREKEADKALEEAEAKLKEAQKKASDAMDKAKEAEHAEDAAHDQLVEKAGEFAKQGGNSTGNGTDNATDNGTDAGGDNASADNGSAGVAKSEMELEECMKQLANATAKVKKLLVEKQKRHDEHLAALVNQTKAAEADAQAVDVVAKMAEATRKAEDNHKASIKSYEESKARLDKLQAELEKKASKLRVYREKSMGKAGDLYHDTDVAEKDAVKKSDAVRAAVLLPVFLAVLAALGAA